MIIADFYVDEILRVINIVNTQHITIELKALNYNTAVTQCKIEVTKTCT